MTRTFLTAVVLVGITGIGGLNTPESNPLTPEKIASGRKLFFDTSLSADKKTSCATCHDPAKAFTDGKALAVGIHSTTGTRNSPTLVNAGNGRLFFWDGRADSLEAQALQPMINPKEMGMSDTDIEKRTGMKVVDVTDALASYVRTTRSHESRVDYFRAGQTEMLSADEKAGFEIFRGKGQCTPCHGGPNFTDDRFHNTGVGFRNGSNAPICTTAASPRSRMSWSSTRRAASPTRTRIRACGAQSLGRRETATGRVSQGAERADYRRASQVGILPPLPLTSSGGHPPHLAGRHEVLAAQL
jgi:cytochrome c peroxidase